MSENARWIFSLFHVRGMRPPDRAVETSCRACHATAVPILLTLYLGTGFIVSLYGGCYAQSELADDQQAGQPWRRKRHDHTLLRAARAFAQAIANRIRLQALCRRCGTAFAVHQESATAWILACRDPGLAVLAHEAGHDLCRHQNAREREDLQRIKCALTKLASACRGKGPTSECPILDALESTEDS